MTTRVKSFIYTRMKLTVHLFILLRSLLADVKSCLSHVLISVTDLPMYLVKRDSNHSQRYNTVKIRKIRISKIITVIVLQMEQLDFSVQYYVQKTE